MPNSFGQIFRITTWGESHGGSVGVVVDGCPSNIPLDESDIQGELNRRKPGQSSITTPRKEDDLARIYSGTFQGKTLGTPICIMVMNKDARPHDYDEISGKFRPSHSDFGYQTKYGIRNWEGGGRSSARETIGRVAAAPLPESFKTPLQCGDSPVSPRFITSKPSLTSKGDDGPGREYDRPLPGYRSGREMIQCIKDARKAGDSVGGIIHCIARNVPAGLRTGLR